MEHFGKFSDFPFILDIESYLSSKGEGRSSFPSLSSSVLGGRQTVSVTPVPFLPLGLHSEILMGIRQARVLQDVNSSRVVTTCPTSAGIKACPIADPQDS